MRAVCAALRPSPTSRNHRRIRGVRPSCGVTLQTLYNWGVNLVCVLDTPNRCQFDAACSLLRHEGIPFQLRETRGGIVPYFTHDELRIFVSAGHAQEAGELLALLDQPAF